MNRRLENRLRKEIGRLPLTAVLDTSRSPWTVETRLRGIGRVLLLFPTDYPFRPPKMFVHGVEYNTFLRIESPRFLRLYDRMFGGRCSCACHSSILAPDRWSPAYEVRDILGDLERLHHDKCLVAYSLVVDKIKARHRIPEEMDILSFL